MRAEWQASAGIADSKETKKMIQLVGQSTEIVCTLSWAVPGENNGKKPFQPSELDVLDFAVIHGQFTSQVFHDHTVLTLP